MNIRFGLAPDTTLNSGIWLGALAANDALAAQSKMPMPSSWRAARNKLKGEAPLFDLFNMVNSPCRKAQLSDSFPAVRQGLTAAARRIEGLDALAIQAELAAGISSHTARWGGPYRETGWTVLGQNDHVIACGS